MCGIYFHYISSMWFCRYFYRLFSLKLPASWKYLRNIVCGLRAYSCQSHVSYSQVFSFWLWHDCLLAGLKALTHHHYSSSATGSSFCGRPLGYGLSLTRVWDDISWNILLCLHQIKAYNLDLMSTVLVKMVRRVTGVFKGILEYVFIMTLLDFL